MGPIYMQKQLDCPLNQVLQRAKNWDDTLSNPILCWVMFAHEVDQESVTDCLLCTVIFDSPECLFCVGKLHPGLLSFNRWSAHKPEIKCLFRRDMRMQHVSVWLHGPVNGDQYPHTRMVNCRSIFPEWGLLARLPKIKPTHLVVALKMH